VLGVGVTSRRVGGAGEGDGLSRSLSLSQRERERARVYKDLYLQNGGSGRRPLRDGGGGRVDEAGVVPCKRCVLWGGEEGVYL
jgi:hypothetical protein